MAGPRQMGAALVALLLVELCIAIRSPFDNCGGGEGGGGGGGDSEIRTTLVTG